MTIRVLIIDDETLARDRVRRLAKAEQDLDIIGECDSGAGALEVIASERPQLLFLDVQMPEMDGFQMLAELPAGELPLVIFTTAYDRHAVRAFETHAVDYLLKPFKPARFAEAVARARKRIASGRTEDTSTALQALLDAAAEPAAPRLARITVKHDDRTLVVHTDDIEAFEVAGNYIAAYVDDACHIFRESLSALEKQLDPGKFLRVSRSTIVNLDRVRELQPMFKGEHVIVLHSSRRVSMTRGVREVEKAIRYGNP